MNNDCTAMIEAANAAWNKELNTGNAKALAQLYAENAILSPGNGKTLGGRAEIEALFQGFVDAGVHNHTLQIIESYGSGNVVYQIAGWSAQGAETDGKTPVFGGITTSVMEQGPDEMWLIRSHVWNVSQ